MMLDEVTLRNLEILRNIRDRSRRGTLAEFLGETRTPMGARTLVRWIQMPLLSLEKIKRRLDAVEELFRDSVLRSILAEELKEHRTWSGWSPESPAVLPIPGIWWR